MILKAKIIRIELIYKNHPKAKKLFMKNPHCEVDMIILYYPMSLRKRYDCFAQLPNWLSEQLKLLPVFCLIMRWSFLKLNLQ